MISILCIMYIMIYVLLLYGINCIDKLAERNNVVAHRYADIL